MTYNFKEHLKHVLRNDAMNIITEQMGFGGNAQSTRMVKRPMMRPQSDQGQERSMDPPYDPTQPPPGYEGNWEEGYTWEPCGADCGPYSNGWVQVFDQNGELTRVLDPGPDGQFGGGDDQVWPPGSEQTHNGNVAVPGNPPGCWSGGGNCVNPPGEFDRQKRWFKPIISWCRAQPPRGAGVDGQLVIAPDANGNWTWWMEVNNPDYDPDDPNSQAKIWMPYDFITRLKEEGWDGTPEGLPDWAVIMLSILGGFLGGMAGAAVYDLVFGQKPNVQVPTIPNPGQIEPPIGEPPITEPPELPEVPIAEPPPPTGPPTPPGPPPITEPPITEPPAGGGGEPPIPPIGGGGGTPITFNPDDDDDERRLKRPTLA